MTDSKRTLEEDICVHILMASSAMLGVCVTVIGLVRIVIIIGKANTLIDDILSAGALFFLGACFASYWALRSRSAGRMHRIERIADVLFLAGMTLMAVSCFLITFWLAAG